MKGEIITSLENSMIKEARSLTEKKYRRFHGKFLVDGKKLVNEVVLGAAEVDKIFVDGTRLAEFSDILANFDGKVVPVTPKVLDSISENATPQGIIAEVFMRETGEFKLERNEPISRRERASYYSDSTPEPVQQPQRPVEQPVVKNDITIPVAEDNADSVLNALKSAPGTYDAGYVGSQSFAPSTNPSLISTWPIFFSKKK